eukprot:gene23130-29323_t
MSIFQHDKVNDMIHEDVQSLRDLIMTRKASLFRRSADMKQEITESAIVVDSLIHYSNSMINLPSGPVCRIDGIHTDWTRIAKMQQKILTSNRSVNFSAHMISRGHPVCGAVYTYLQSTKSYANVLEIADYSFESGEFGSLVAYLDKQHSDNATSRTNSEVSGRKVCSVFESVHSLIISNCGLTDKDCHMLSARLGCLANMHTLVLSNNKLTCSGVTSIATAVFESGSLVKCLRFDGNNIKSDGLGAIAEVLHRMPFLQTLSVAHNPVGDKGVYKLLRKCMNSHRKAYRSLPRPTRGGHAGGSVAGSAAETEYEEGSVGGEDEAAEGEEVDRLFSRSKMGEQCYFADYYAKEDAEDVKNSDLLRAMFEGGAKGGSAAAGWMTSEEDEYLMDTASDYSEGESGEEDEVTARLRAEKARLDRENQPVVLTRAELRLTYPRIIQALIKIRLKLVAVNAFLRVLRKGAMLTSLNLAQCGLTRGVAETISHALMDDKNMTSLDVSDNERLLEDVDSCNAFAALLEHSHLSSVKLSGCGVNDYGAMQLAKSAMKAAHLHHLDLSRNYIGSTGANWIATASKVFYLDVLELKGGFHKTAPFMNIDTESRVTNRDHQFIDATFDDEDLRRRPPRGGRKSDTDSYYRDDGEDDDPYEDTDTYEGDEGDGGDSQYSEEQSGDETREGDYYEEDREGDDHTEASRYDDQDDATVEVVKRKKRFGIM